MATLRFSATVGRDRRLTLTLPDDIPAGEIEVVVRSLAADADHDVYDETAKVTLRHTNMATEMARARLQEAGRLAPSPAAPDLVTLLSAEALWAIGAKAMPAAEAARTDAPGGGEA